MSLLLTARNRGRLEEVAREISPTGRVSGPGGGTRTGSSDETFGVIRTAPADLQDPDAPDLLIRRIQETFGRLDLLVNNAGIAISKRIEDTSLEDWEQLMAVNGRAPFLLCRSALPLLKRSSRGTIVNISSVVGRLGYSGQAAYTASKHAVTGFTKALAREIADTGVRVHLISPGGVATDMVARMRPDIPEEELISPEEIAHLVRFLFEHRGHGVIDEINIRRFSSTPWK